MKAVGEVSKAGAVRVDNDKDICHGVEIDAVEADEDEEVATHIISDGLILGFSGFRERRHSYTSRPCLWGHIF